MNKNNKICAMSHCKKEAEYIAYPKENLKYEVYYCKGCMNYQKNCNKEHWERFNKIIHKRKDV